MYLEDIEPLIKLLDDDNQYVLDQVEAKLLFYFDKVSPSIWSYYLNWASEKARERFENLYYNYTYKIILEQMQSWIIKPILLSEALYLVSKIFNPFLEYNSFLSHLFKYTPFFPDKFATNFSPIEQAQFVLRLFFHHDELKKNFNDKKWKNYIPEYALKSNNSSHITYGLIIISALQHISVRWLLLSDIYLTNHYILIPIDKNDGLGLFIDIKKENLYLKSNLEKTEVDYVMKHTFRFYNLISLKSLIIALLQENMLPRKMDDQWYILNRINALLASEGRFVK